ncbi:MAG: DUF2163 domain-containing protein [Tepidisphaerales bacterium]
MRRVSANMQALLSGDAVPALATFWLITREDGVQLGFTDWTCDIKVGTILYQSSPGGSRSAAQQRVDLAAPTMEVTSIVAEVSDEDIRAGKYDGATCRIFLAVPTDRDFLTYGVILIPGAYIGQVKTEDGVYVAEIRGLTYALSQSFVEVYTPTCRADFCDARCKLNPASFTVSAVISVVNSQQAFQPNHIPGGQGPRFGVCTFTSGKNNGFSIEISAWDGVSATLYLPAPFPMTVGDTITLLSGCDKTLGTCANIYLNNLNFRGEPAIPGMNFLFDYGSVAP